MGYGQIYAKTAIDAINWYKNKDKDDEEKENVYNVENWKERKYVWDKLREDNSYNISMVPLVLMYGADEKDLNTSYWKHNEDEIKIMLSRYNGYNEAAQEYGRQAYNCYVIFDRYN